MTKSDEYRGLRLSKSTVLILKGSQRRFTSLTLRIIPKNPQGTTKSDGHRGLRLPKSPVVISIVASSLRVFFRNKVENKCIENGACLQNYKLLDTLFQSYSK